MTNLADITKALDFFKIAPVDPNYPPTIRVLYSPIDSVHAALLWLLNSAESSVCVAMYGFNDHTLADALERKLQDPKVRVQVTLDSTGTFNPHERRILKKEQYPASSIAIGESEGHAIMHLKMLVIDDLITVTGSTNWSPSAEFLQDNALVVIIDPYVAAEAKVRINAIHQHMLSEPRQGLWSKLRELWRGFHNRR